MSAGGSSSDWSCKFRSWLSDSGRVATDLWRDEHRILNGRSLRRGAIIASQVLLEALRLPIP